MTLVEVVVAAFLLVTAVVATLGVIDTSTRSTFRAEETQTVINIAQREVERLHELDYGEIAMNVTAPPPWAPDGNLPTSRIRDVDKFCLDRVDGDDPCTASPLVYNTSGLEGGGQVTGGQVAALSQDVKVGDMTVDIYRFVVWQDEGNELLPGTDSLCQEKPLHFLCKTQDYKRVVVAVRLDEAAISHERPYEEVQSDFIDPDRATLDAEPLGPGGGNVVTGQQFWLSDTRCILGTVEPERETASSHQTHDTLGDCAVPTQAPDALLTGPPLDPDPADPGNPAFFDYSTEIEPPCPDPAPDPLPGGWPIDCDLDDSGLQMLDQDGPCSPGATGGDAHRQIHRWVSSPMAAGFSFEMTDRATLELWTRTIDEVQGASGQVCGFLFKRDALGVDAILTTDSYSASDWPSGPAWEPATLTFDLDNLSLAERTVLPTERVGVSIGVDPSGTPDNVLQFLYDHPEGEGRLEVLTTTPLP